MSVLQEICARKADHVAAKKAQLPLIAVKNKLESAEKPRGFLKALRANTPLAIIAEVKKASPSKGIIREDFDPAEIACNYESSGASCISVLTDEPYFHGHDDYLGIVKSVSKLPVLRKDFMIDEYQIYESLALGADCILLIMAALTDTQARDFYHLSTELGMDTLFEVHDEEELARAITLNPEMIGVNNRNLKTLEVDLKISHTLAQHIPSHSLKISESGIKNAGDIQALQNSGYEAFLIGESLMSEKNIAQTLKKLIDTNHELK